MRSRPASPAERDAVVRCITLAFASDPVWELALRHEDGRTDHHQPYWTLFVDGAMRYGTVHVTDGLEAVSVGNDHRYARAGFRPIGGFRAVRDDTWITAMWRDVGGPTNASPA